MSGLIYKEPKTVKRKVNMVYLKENVKPEELKKYGFKMHYVINENTGEHWVDRIYRDESIFSSYRAIKFIRNSEGRYRLEECEKDSFYIVYKLFKDDLLEVIGEYV